MAAEELRRNRDNASNTTASTQTRKWKKQQTNIKDEEV